MRLIDADALIKNLSYLYTKNHIPIDMRAKEILTTIMEQPTAYSVDKVVEELKRELSLAKKEKERCTGENHLQFDSAKGYASGISYAIEIVKQGGVSDVPDVCEWKVFDNSLTDEPQWVYKTTCGKYIGEEHTLKAFVYCPYCSKKIKVVE